MPLTPQTPNNLHSQMPLGASSQQQTITSQSPSSQRALSTPISPLNISPQKPITNPPHLLIPQNVQTQPYYGSNYPQYHHMNILAQTPPQNLPQTQNSHPPQTILSTMSMFDEQERQKKLKQEQLKEEKLREQQLKVRVLQEEQQRHLREEQEKERFEAEKRRQERERIRQEEEKKKLEKQKEQVLNIPFFPRLAHCHQ